MSNSQPVRYYWKRTLLDRECDRLTCALQEIINTEVPITNISVKSKRWWTKELSMLHREADNLGRTAYKHKNRPEHPVHAEHAKARKKYSKTIQYFKQPTGATGSRRPQTQTYGRHIDTSQHRLAMGGNREYLT